MNIAGTWNMWGISLSLVSIALALTGCVDQENEDLDEPVEVVLLEDWCADGACEQAMEIEVPRQTSPRAPREEMTEPPREEPPITEPEPGEEPERPVEPEPPTEPERPEYVQPETVMGSNISQIAVHSGYGCAVVDYEVACWGDNRQGQAQPPAETYADHLIVEDDFACAASTIGGIVCWGDGAWRVQSIIDDHTIYSRHTISAFDASSAAVSGNIDDHHSTLCFNADYGGTGKITCGDASKQWSVGDVESYGVSVGYLRDGGWSAPIACHIEERYTRAGLTYAYACAVNGERFELPTPNPEGVALGRPQLMVDDDTITILDQSGQVHWYKLEWSWTRSISGVRLELTPMEIDWQDLGGQERFTFEKLLSPDCAWDGYMAACRDTEDKATYILRISSTILSAHQHGDTIDYCHVSWRNETGGQLQSIHCEQLYWRNPYVDGFRGR